MARNSREILLKEQKPIFDLENEGSAFIGNIIAYKVKDAVSHVKSRNLHRHEKATQISQESPYKA
jgi:hypothetical protein